MARYTGPKLRVVRRLGALPGFTQKETSRKSGPGQHGAKKKKLSNYGLQLVEKQKVKINYGLNERQLLNYAKAAKKSKDQMGHALLRSLEMRLDNIIFRLGFAPSIPAARQLVRHNHIHVNGKKVNIPSFSTKIGDVVSIKGNETSQTLARRGLEKPSFMVPDHLSLDKDNLKASIVSACPRESVLLEVNDSLVVGFYSRRI
jgi:small subunit ribosomal protein S4